MRKIEKAMLDAIEAGKNWKLATTEVTVRAREDGAIVTSVYLHGNLIAQNGESGWGYCLRGWNTPTTRSRITEIMRRVELGVLGLGTRKGVPRIVHGDGTVVEVPENDWFEVQGGAS